MKKVHIVTSEQRQERILGRLVSALAPLGYTISDHPDASADLNYFFPYYERDRFPEFSGLSAGWFTHKETTREWKADLWDKLAPEFDLRLTSAEIYRAELEQYGPTAIVTVPLDREKFSPGQYQPRRAKPRLGTSGFVYPGGRKGEDLFLRLTQSELAQRLDIVATGEGWAGARCQEMPYERLQHWYQGLDLYLCTSRIEGIGYGPLEAMACGITVILPRGVGVFDELPNSQFLYRYTAGDYADMERAIGEAIDETETVNAGSLRGITARFTLDAWQGEHRRAIEQLFYGAPPVEILPEWRGNAGVYTVAYGEPARECAARLIKSLRKQMPGLPVALVAAEPLNLGEIFIKHSDDDLGARSVKTEIYNLAPQEWRYVLYLDADTEVVKPINFLFEILRDGWEFAICINPAQYVLGKEMARPDNQDECRETWEQIGTDLILQANGGVFSFQRCKRVARFFADWHKEWLRHAKRDQAALDRALYRAPLRMYMLGNEWNTITRYLPAERTAGILHYPMQARRWRGRINGRLDGDEAWASLHPGGKK